MSATATAIEPTGPERTALGITFRDAVPVWSRIALMSFGGPAGQIAMMHKILVEEERWIGEERFLHALSYCMLLPGPEAQQLATYIGWLMHRTRGGLVAGGLFILPGFVAIMALSFFYVLFSGASLVGAFFFGLKAAVLAIVLQALLRIARRSLRTRAAISLAAAAFLAMFLLSIPFPLVIAGAALVSFVVPGGWFSASAGHLAARNALADEQSALGTGIPDHAKDHSRALLTALVLFAAWLVPVAAIFTVAGPDDVFSKIAGFFSTMAVVTFGGAYAVLAYVAQQAVGHYHWLSAGEMLDGLGLAETTPGPLIMVTQFVGFLAGYRAATGMPPLVAGTLAAILTTWVTFVPCFVWIFAGAPFIEQLRGNARAAATMSAVSAAVVGVIANLAAWFAIHFMFGRVTPRGFLGRAVELPDLFSVHWAALMLSAVCLVCAFALRMPTYLLLLGSSLAAAALTLLGAI